MINRMQNKKMGWWSGIELLTRADWSLLVRDRRFAVAVAGALFIPALYALIYLSSMWDPSTRTSALRAGLVNADTGVVFRGATTRMGEEVSQTLLMSLDVSGGGFAEFIEIGRGQNAVPLKG